MKSDQIVNRVPRSMCVCECGGGALFIMYLVLVSLLQQSVNAERAHSYLALVAIFLSLLAAIVCTVTLNVVYCNLQTDSRHELQLNTCSFLSAPQHQRTLFLRGFSSRFKSVRGAACMSHHDFNCINNYNAQEDYLQFLNNCTLLCEASDFLLALCSHF